MADRISDETIEYIGILSKLELGGAEKEAAKADAGVHRYVEWAGHGRDRAYGTYISNL